MATSSDLKVWVVDALQSSGPATVPQIAKHIWDNHEAELRSSGNLFYTWQYAMRWAGQQLQMEGKLRKKGAGRTWFLL
ncbi:hypothetical protein HMF7854_03485 [Sphingomonas ginkgonis]|uniref:Restriction system protein Mrr-like N-terminal domain-containing protein n=1 Tax=Sphingomonas ginkgonis TaxID=2315330 RepID=A0A429V7R2_9SPHN|nr:hypothetical protein HMF7854_03485 [Sphingomonas ginkgonis]